MAIEPAAPALPDNTPGPAPASSGRSRNLRRSLTDRAITSLSVLATVIVLAPLVAILAYLLYKGFSSLNVAFFTNAPRPVGEEGGGMANAIVGSGIVLLIASAIGIPLGIGAGVYLAEYGRGKLLANFVRFTADVLNGVPSIVMGIAAYSLIVIRQHHFSALAGGIALAIMMVPTVTRTTEEMLATVPGAVREAALGLGIPKWRTTISVALRTASPGIITGCMLAFSRVAGETAPLLFTAFGNQFFSVSMHTPLKQMPGQLLNQPIAALPLQIYIYAVSPYDEWHRLAWAGALVLIVLIMASVTLVRIFAGRGQLKGNS